MSASPALSDPSLFREAGFVAGAWVPVTEPDHLAVTSPATGVVLGHVPSLGREATRRAIDAAEAAWPQWRARPATERAALLMAWHDAILANVDDLALIMTLEQGKPLAEARGEVRYGAGFIRWFAAEAERVYGQLVPAPEAGRRIVVMKEPVGIAAAITPWNFPIAMITRKCAPALAAGCPIIVKPSEFTPFSALALAVLAERAGLPAGLLSVLTGLPAEIGAELTGNPKVRKLSFTGSTPVGRHLMRQCADTVKRLSLELGGNAPFIVFDDADVEVAIAGVMASKFRNAGQTCVCANRILVQGGIYEAFADKLAAAVAALRVGDGREDGVTIGPLINDAAVGKVEAHIADALAQGATLRAGGARHSRGGTFFAPTVLTGATAGMLVAREETFGPVAPLFRFENEDEALRLANDTPYGLAAYFYTQDLKRSWRVAERLEFGMVGLNTGSVSIEAAPFGGVKQSGLGREGSSFGIEEYLEIKAFHIGGL